MSVIKGNLSDGKPMEYGGWYNGQQWNGSSLGPAGVETVGANAGKAVSKEVIAQTNPNNVQYVEQLQANQLQQAPQVSLTQSTSPVAGNISSIQSQVDTSRKVLDTTLATQKTEADKKLADLKTKEAETLKSIGTLTEPFRADLEAAQRDQLYITKNFEDNQKLVDELDQLLTEGNDLIKQQQEVTGLAAIRNPRIQQTMNDVASRAGVIQAVMSARNSQISVAENFIDRTVSAISADRADQISYYETILNLNNRDILSVDAEQKTIAAEQLNLLKSDNDRATATADYIKKLLLDPATAALMGDAGVSLNDSVESINAKLTQTQYIREVADLSNNVTKEGGVAVVDPKSVPANQLVTLTDSKGVAHYYKMPAKTTSTGSGSTALKIDSASKQDMSFSDFVSIYANTMDLADIYTAYSKSKRGQQFGPPKEKANEIALLYKVSRGEMTPTEARAALE